MSAKTSRLIVVTFLLLTGVAFGQEPAGRNDDSNSLSGAAGFFQSSGVSDMVKIAGDLREAGKSLERFAESMKEIASTAGEAAASTSQNLSAIGGEFDPFGFKTAFETIQQQNAIIQAQHQIIMELQQKEIRRLEQENQTARRSKRPTRRPKPPKTTDESPVRE